MDIKSLGIQRQIIENSKLINESFKDLSEWEKDMNKKDTIVKSHNTKVKEIDIPEEKEEIKAQSKNVQLKRDKNSIKDYYNTWDKVNEDNIELNDVESSVVVNTSTPSPTKTFEKTSNAQPNLNVKIINNRLVADTHLTVEKLKNEANAHFAMGSYNRAIELYIHAINTIGNDDKLSNKEKTDLLIPLYNNKGLIDFNFVLDYDKTNVKGLFRRGMCHFGLNDLHLALEDFNLASKLTNEQERKVITEFIDQTVGKINSLITKEKNKMQNFEYSEKLHFRKLHVVDFNSEEMKLSDDSIDLRLHLQKKEDRTIKTDGKEKIKSNINYTNKAVMKEEEITKFVYDISKENLTSSTFKYSLRNFKDNSQGKDDYLLTINPQYIPKIFQSDLDKETLMEILHSINRILNRENFNGQDKICAYLKNITKVGRFKLLTKLLSKKDKDVLNTIFSTLESKDCDVLVIQDAFLN